MGEPERVSAGEAFKRELEANPDARAGWERARVRLKIFGELISEAEKSIREDREAALQELGDAIRDAMQQTGRELEAVGFEPPRTIEEWQHLAHLVEMPFETIRKGNFTAADVYAVAMAWVDRQKLKAKLAENEGVSAPSHTNEPAEIEGEPAPPALTSRETTVLRTLAVFDPSELASASRIEAAMEPAVRLSERSIGPAVKRLIELGLAERPQGERSGARLTIAGRRLARKIAD
jgi:hypothetical protein